MSQVRTQLSTLSEQTEDNFTWSVTRINQLEEDLQNAHEAGIWVGICGELGADLSLTATFLRMGVDELSVAAAGVLPLRAKVRSLDMQTSEKK